MINFLNAILSFLNNNIGLVTLVVGLFVFLVYKKQASENKRNTAKLILQEIRYAEQQMKIAKIYDFNYKLTVELLPTNNWYGNIHLFLKNFKETEIDLISNFYSQVSFVDKIIKTISDFKTGKLPLSTNVQQVSSAIPTNLPPTSLSPSNLPQGIPVQGHGMVLSEPPAVHILKEVSNNVEAIYNTPAIDKLRCISEKRWYNFFN